MWKHRIIFICVLLAIFACGMGVVLAITQSGTDIESQATIYEGLEGQYSYRSNTVNTVVAPIHGLDLNANLSETVLPGQTYYFPKILTNVGNTTENVFVMVSPVTSGWSVQLIKDDNNDGSHQAGEVTPVPPTEDLSPVSAYKFFVAMTAPPTYNVTGTVNITVSASVASVVTTSYQGNNQRAYGGPLLVAEMNTLSTIASPAAGGPTVSDLKFDGVLVVNKDYIGRTPLITAKILDSDGVSASSLKITIDGIVITQGITFDGSYLSYMVTTTLRTGTHIFNIEAQDVSGNTGGRTFVGQITEKAVIVGQVLPYPSPFNPDEGEAKITYQLTNDTGIRIYIYTFTGERIWEVVIDKGEEGGHAGYNEVLWNGTTGFREQVGNGVYLVQITDSKGKLLAKTKILVIR